MRKVITLLLAAAMLFSLAACSGSNTAAGSGSNTGSVQSGTDESQAAEPSAAPAESESEGEQPDEVPDASAEAPEGGKILVAYFSATNITEGVAQTLAEGLGADLYEITPEQPYTEEDLAYGNDESRPAQEREDPDARPAIAGSVENMEQYDVIFLGYPIWWGEAPRIVSTFIESYDFSGKTIAPFCTSDNSGFDDSDAALREAASGATWLEGQRFPAGVAAEDILGWANWLGLG